MNLKKVLLSKEFKNSGIESIEAMFEKEKICHIVSFDNYLKMFIVKFDKEKEETKRVFLSQIKLTENGKRVYKSIRISILENMKSNLLLIKSSINSLCNLGFKVYHGDRSIYLDDNGDFVLKAKRKDFILKGNLDDLISKIIK